MKPQSADAEVRVSSLQNLFCSWNKHLQPKADSLSLHLLDERTQALVVFLECLLKISGMLLERVRERGGSHNRQRPSHPCCGRSAITSISYQRHSTFGP